MNIFTKRVSAMALAIGAASLTAACGGHGPNSYLMPKEPLMEKLASSSKDYKVALAGRTSVTSGTWSGDKMRVTITSASGNKETCYAVVEAINEEWTRVTPDCGSFDADDVTEKMENQLNRMKVDELIIAVLYDNPMNAQSISNRTSAIVLENFGEIQAEAAASMQEAAAASEANGTGRGSGWGDDTSHSSKSGW